MLLLLTLVLSCGGRGITTTTKTRPDTDKIYVLNSTTGEGEIMLYADYIKLIDSGGVTVTGNGLADIYDKLNDDQRDEYTLHIATELTKRAKR